MPNILAISSIPDRPEAALLRGLAAAGLNVTVLSEASELFQGIPNLTSLPFKIKSRLDFKSAWSIRHLVQRRKIDLIHSFSAKALTVALFGTVGLASKHIAYRGTVGHLSKLDPMSWLSFLNPRVNAISCVSKAVQDYLLSLNISPSKLQTIYKGHDHSWYDTPPQTTRAQLNIPEDALVGCFLGNMRRVKGADLIIRALDLLPESSRIFLLLVGEIRDQEVHAALQSVRRRERIRETGFRADGTTLLKLCDFNIMPSREREGFPKAVIEGMAQGIPPIVTSVGGMPEMVEDGRSGLVVIPNSPEALAQACLKLETDTTLRANLAAGARTRVMETFPISRTISETLALYQRVFKSA